MQTAAFEPQRVVTFGPRRLSRGSDLQICQVEALRNPVNLRKDSISFVPAGENVIFEFSCDSTEDFKISADFLATFSDAGVRTSVLFSPPEISRSPGMNILVRYPSPIDVKALGGSKALDYHPQAVDDKWPLVITLEAGNVKQLTFVTFNLVEGVWAAHPVRQAILIAGRPFEYYDLFGSTEDTAVAECVVCMTEMRDVAVLPCRHLCLCRQCARIIQSSPVSQQRCPICRQGAARLVQLSPKPV